MKKILTYILSIISLGAALFSLLGYLGTHHWILDIFSHFKPQYLILLLISSIGFLLLKEKRSLALLPFLLLNIYEISPLYFDGNVDEDLAISTKIVCINLLSSNREFEAAEQFISDESADILVLQEFNTIWQQKLALKLQDYNYRLEIPRNDNFGIAIYSKINFLELEEAELGNVQVPSIKADFELNGKVITLLATHTLPPVGAVYFNRRNAHLNDIAEFASESTHEIVVIGDLNISSFSNHFKQLIHDSNLTDTRQQFGLLPTWPSWFGGFSTTLDHCLISDGITVKSRAVGGYIGSDHFPIIVEIGVE